MVLEAPVATVAVPGGIDTDHLGTCVDERCAVASIGLGVGRVAVKHDDARLEVFAAGEVDGAWGHDGQG